LLEERVPGTGTAVGVPLAVVSEEKRRTPGL
jgi:hypothetical protein